MKIVITRAEGFIDECGKPQEFATFAEANAALRKMSDTAPKGGSYDKCGFSITVDQDGLKLDYKGRYDLKHWSEERADLQAHVLGHLAFMSGKACPSHFTPERYEALLSAYSAEYKQEAEDARAWLAQQP